MRTIQTTEPRLNTSLSRYSDLDKRIEPSLLQRVRNIMVRNGEIEVLAALTQGKKV
jgi:hypothetical protein